MFETIVSYKKTFSTISLWGFSFSDVYHTVLRHFFSVPFKPFRYEYHWADGTTIKKPIKCSAPKYIDYLMTWVQDQLDDETLFPSKIGKRW